MSAQAATAGGGGVTISALESINQARLGSLADLLVDCVDGGATVTFLRPLSTEKALAFWRGVDRDVRSGARVLLVAEEDGAVVGTVQLIVAQPENQPARADLVKMLVHRRARRRGIAQALMRSAEDAARAAGKSLLVLETPDDAAERLYLKLGWTRVGSIPGYALTAHGEVCSTTFFYKALSRASSHSDSARTVSP